MKRYLDHVAREYLGLLSVLVGLIVLFSLKSEHFFSLITFTTLANQLPTLTVIAVGMTFVLIVAGIDLSVGSVMAFSGAILGVALLDVGLPLFLVTLASQNLPGLVVLRAAGYAPPANLLILATGLTSVIAAPFGAHGVNLAAITAALCTGPDAHPDPARRWIVGVIYGGFYLIVALFAAPLAGLFIAMPPAVLAVITGLALVEDQVAVLFDQGEEGVAPGQACVLYDPADPERVLGGGFIRDTTAALQA